MLKAIIVMENELKFLITQIDVDCKKVVLKYFQIGKFVRSW